MRELRAFSLPGNHLFNVRLIGKGDIRAVLELERACGLSSRREAEAQQLLERPEWIMIGAFASLDVRADVRQEVHEELEGTEELVGFFCGQVVVDEFQIDNLAVVETARQKGLGRHLVNVGLEVASLQGALSAVLELRVANILAQRVYLGCGFEVVGRRIAYYSSPSEDALQMFCALTTSSTKKP